MSQAVIGNLQVRMGLDSAEFANGVRSVQGSLASLGSSLKAFATATAAVTVFQQAVTALRDVADLGDVAEAIGITAEQLQVYQRMALASGASSDVMMRGLQSIAEQSVDTKSKLSQLFAANDIVMAGKTMNEIILEFMTLLQNARTPAEQLAIATDVLGTKVGRQLVESLRAGSQGWQEEFAQMTQSGNYLANESVKEAARIETAYNQAMANIQIGWQRMVVAMVRSASSLATALDPIINPDFSKSTAGGELWRYLTGQKVDWNFGKPPPEFSNAPAVNMGPMGGPGQFKPMPMKVTLIPPPPAETAKVKDAIQKTVNEAVYVPPDTIDSIYGSGEAFSDLWARMEEGIPTTNLVAESFQNIADTISNTLGYALEGLISGTMSVKDAFKSMAQSISQQLSQLAAELIKSSIFKLLSIVAGGAVGGGAGINIGGMTYGGRFANGGHLGSGQWGIAGEAGPEIIHGPANITPMDRLAGGSQVNVTVNNYAGAEVRTNRGEDGRLQIDILKAEIAKDIARGGNTLAQTFERSYGMRRAGR